MKDHEKRKQAQKMISEQLRIATKAIETAERISDMTGVDFSWDGPTYGMGGTYWPAKSQENNWESSDEQGWSASSQSC